MGKDRGFSLLELLITISVALILMAVTFIALQPMFYKARVDSAYDTAMMVLRDTRHLAITQSHQYLVVFNNPVGTIQVQYQPPAVGGVAPPVQVVNTYALPPDVSFAVQAGFPANAPDGFGTGAAAIDFGQGLGAGSLNFVCFMPDGTSRDAQGGNYNSGIVYITRLAGTIYDSRAITVWGATGRIRGWNLIQQAGAPIWAQQ